MVKAEDSQPRGSGFKERGVNCSNRDSTPFKGIKEFLRRCTFFYNSLNAFKQLRKKFGVENYNLVTQNCSGENCRALSLKVLKLKIEDDVGFRNKSVEAMPIHKTNQERGAFPITLHYRIQNFFKLCLPFDGLRVSVFVIIIVMVCVLRVRHQ